MGVGGAVLCVVCLLGTPALADLGPHVRSTSGSSRWLIESALEYSPTVSALAARIERSDVVAYIRLVPLRSGTAQTVLLNCEGPIRYLLISIDVDLSPDVLVEMLAHELQHAVEISAAREVRDDVSLAALYRRIGLHRGAKTRFETVLAQEMGRRARRDLSNRPAALYVRAGSQ